MASSKTIKSDGDRRQYLSNYFLTVIVSAGMGAGLTWMFTSQRSELHRALSSPAPASQPDVGPDVTGMTPGQSALVLANFAYDHQHWPEAIRKYQEAIGAGIDNADVHTDLGNAYRFSGQPKEALNQYILAQRSNPQHENSLFNQIGLFTEVLNEPRRAVPICEEFIRRFPTSDKIPAVQQQLARAKGTAP